MASTWTVNVNPAERVARIVLGVLGAGVGAFLLTDTGAVLATALEAALVITGLDLVVTGVVGHCPLYATVGHVSASLKGRNR